MSKKHIFAIDQYFRALGAKEGIIYNPVNEYTKAQKIASKYIRKYYRNHPLARRLHYMMKQLGLIENKEDEIYVIDILYYDDYTIGIRIWDNNKEELLHTENIKTNHQRKQKATQYSPKNTSMNQTMTSILLYQKDSIDDDIKHN